MAETQDPVEVAAAQEVRRPERAERERLGLAAREAQEVSAEVAMVEKAAPVESGESWVPSIGT